MESVKSAARSLDLPLQILEVYEPGDFDAAFSAMRQKRTARCCLGRPDVLHPSSTAATLQ